MTVNIEQQNGIRYGSFNILGIQGNVPQQAITSTNLNHAKDSGNPNFNFKTNILKIIEFDPMKLTNDEDYKKTRIKKISKIISENPDKLCLLVIRGAKGSLKLTKDVNESLIKFQIDCGFKLIEAFFKYTKNALANSKYYRSLIPTGASYVAVLNENLTHSIFKSLYMDCLKNKDEIIGFMGREPSKKNSLNLKNKLNFQFIARRSSDQMIRITSFTPKSIDNVASAYVYNLFGFDVYSSLTRRGNQNIPKTELKALNGFKYVPLEPKTSLICVLTGKNLYESSKYFENKISKSSLPLSVHAIVRLNEMLENMHKKFTRLQLEKIVGKSFYRFSG